MTSQKQHDATTCGACALIAFRHASGGTLDPDASQQTTAKAWQSPFAGTREWRDAMGRALDLKLAVWSEIDAAVMNAKPASEMLSILAVEDYDRAMGLKVRS